jgi:hypothetical protein
VRTVRSCVHFICIDRGEMCVLLVQCFGRARTSTCTYSCMRRTCTSSSPCWRTQTGYDYDCWGNGDGHTLEMHAKKKTEKDATQRNATRGPWQLSAADSAGPGRPSLSFPAKTCFGAKKGKKRAPPPPCRAGTCGRGSNVHSLLSRVSVPGIPHDGTPAAAATDVWATLWSGSRRG